MSEPINVVVFSENREVGLELVTLGRRLAGTDAVVAVALDDGTEAADGLVACGADEVCLVRGMGGSTGAGVQIDALRQVLEARQTEIILIGATRHGTEIAARLAQSLEVGCATDCTEIEVCDNRVLVQRTYLGRFVARQVIHSRPAIATIPRHLVESMEPDPSRCGRVHELDVRLARNEPAVVATRPRGTSRVRIDKADVVVAVGRGLRDRDDLRLVEELAQALGGVVAASRPLTDDLQWLPEDRKVGLSGRTVKPRLYVACGVSGQIEHSVGMRDSGIVVAINIDPNAPIMQEADFCIAGDLYEIVPAFTAALRRESDLAAPPS